MMWLIVWTGNNKDPHKENSDRSLHRLPKSLYPKTYGFQGNAWSNVEYSDRGFKKSERLLNIVRMYKYYTVLNTLGKTY